MPDNSKNLKSLEQEITRLSAEIQNLQDRMASADATENLLISTSLRYKTSIQSASGAIKAQIDLIKQLRQQEAEKIREKIRLTREYNQAATGGGTLPGMKGIPTDREAGQTEEEDTNFNVQQLKNLSEAYGTVFKNAEQLGFTHRNLRDVYEEASTGIKRFTFQMSDEDGVMRKLSVTADRHGNILRDTQKRYRSLGDTIARNIREVAKWTVAIQVIYGPMRKLSELFELMVDNETKLANITIAVGRNHADVAKIFGSISEVARATGESINGVIEGYELAYRAAGSASSENERLAITQKLLTDSMVLSKLSTLTQAQALDTLIGALKQTGRDLTDGTELIDKWVQLSKVANVSVETLAESFAITATSATNAKLSLEELNAVVAIVAENTTLSATEAGNAVRAFISGFQTDKARQELSKYGVYLETATGEALGFYDVMRQISELADAQIISQSELNAIGEAIGGGARRGAQVVATIKNLGDVQKYTAAQVNSHGAAEEALSIQLETVRTKLTESSNAFQRLAQSVGTEGGLLSTFKVLLDIINGIVDGITKLSDTLGAALPTLVGFAVIYNQLATNRRFTGLGLTGQKFMPQGIPTGGRLEKFTGSIVPFTGGRNVGSYLQGGELGGKLPGIVTGGITTLVNAAINAMQGEWDRVGGNLGGAVVGGILSGGNPIGIALGSAIGDTFVTSVLDYKPELENFFKELFPTLEEAKGATVDKTKEEQLADEIFKRSGVFGTEFGGKFATALDQAFINFAREIAPGRFGNMASVTREQVALSRLNEDERQAFEERIKELRRLQQVQEGTFVSEKDQTRQIQIAKEYSGVLQELTDEYLAYSREQIATGGISAKQFKDAKDEAQGLNAKVAQLAATFGDDLIRNVDNIGSMEDAIRAIGEVVTTSSDEQLSYVEELSASISLYSKYLDELSGKELSTEQLEEQAIYMNRLNDATSEAINYFSVLQRESKLIKIEFPSITNLEDVIRQADLDAVFDEARRLTREYISAGISEGLYGGLTADEVVSTLEPVMVKAGGDLGYVFGEGFMSQFLPDAEKNLTDLGRIIGDNLDLKGFEDVSREQLINLSKQSVSIANQIKAAIPGYEPNLEAFIGIAEDGIAGPIVAEMTILQLLMKDLIDVNEKQLEGIYNLPTDASFYVPFTGYALGQDRGGGGIGDITKLLTDILALGIFQQEETTVGTTKTTREERRKLEAEPTQFKENLERRYRGAAGENQTSINEDALTNALNNLSKEGIEKDKTPAWLRPLESVFNNLAESLSWIWEGTADLKTGDKGFGKATTDLSNTLNEISASLAKSDEINTNLTIEINSTSLLQLDGQVVANIVKSYIGEELLRQAGTSSISRSLVI